MLVRSGAVEEKMADKEEGSDTNPCTSRNL